MMLRVVQGLEELWKCLNGGYKLQQERTQTTHHRSSRNSLLISHSVAKVSLQAESKTSFLSCQTFQLLFTR